MDVNMDHVWLGFLFTFGASLATTIGSMAAFFVRLKDKHVLAASLGLSAGVMLYVSFVEILSGSREKFHSSLASDLSISNDIAESRALLYATICFFSGMILTGLLDLIVHHLHSGYHSHGEAAIAMESSSESDVENAVPKSTTDMDLKRASLVAALAVALHNIPEGLTTFMATLKNPKIGLSISVAIGIHNILEGLCVSMPLYFATGSRWRAFFWSAASGIVEFLGAVFGFVVLKAFMSDFAFGIVFALVGGMMVFVSTRELLPLARRYDPNDRVVTWSVLSGMFLMAICLVFSGE